MESAMDGSRRADRPRTKRVAVAAEPLLGDAAYDYADAFEVRLDQPDTHTAEQWVRTALEESPAVVVGLVRFVHARIAGFQPSSAPGNVLGWQVASTSADTFHIRTSGRLLRAEIVARRTSPTVAGFSTYLFYEKPITRVVWAFIGPLHRLIAPYLLRRAASSLTKPTVAAQR